LPGAMLRWIARGQGPGARGRFGQPRAATPAQGGGSSEDQRAARGPRLEAWGLGLGAWGPRLGLRSLPELMAARQLRRFPRRFATPAIMGPVVASRSRRRRLDAHGSALRKSLAERTLGPLGPGLEA
jgi:hypothetical protein